MPSICLNTAISITGLSRRTLWRRISEGRITALGVHGPGEETRLNLDDVLPLCSLPTGPDECEIIIKADQGDAIAQSDLAILLLMAERPADAIPWFTLSAKQFYPDAMRFLGRLYLSGEGAERNIDMGVMWLNHAAIKGHPIAQAFTLFLQSPKGQSLLQDQAALDTALDDIERKLILEKMAEIADQE